MFQRMILTTLLSAAAASAHHSIAAEYDNAKMVVLNGKITKVGWMNPHVYFWMDVADASGKVTNWELESAAPNYLMRLGWTKGLLKPGDVVTVRAYVAKDQANLAKTDTVMFPDGTRITTGHADDLSAGHR